ncbi:hypothetical protein JCM8115_004655 [Rhodotorula mucilaginosa]|uniref:PRELI/MSF1 domain-containing protein n=1 Tax=Rhodotorula mucilaginosa TaxID=5537 RepID=A0A9P7B8X8_RHOMI|nr:hypothetical protein C6P46_006792 [Rhodotorula mucilaginosa]TKA53227.1 hypothetical protein B0A53_04083 [Rhodotorula sp. CCFEE 5036]
MVGLFTTAFAFSYPWPAQTYAVLNKYPNPLAPHVISIDVVDRSILPDGTVRSERILGIQQDSPRWIRRILGTPDVTYAREVSFIVPASTAHPHTASTTAPSQVVLEPPKLLMASTNLSLSSLLQCRETISYLPHPWPHLPLPTRRQFAPKLRSSVRNGDSEDGEGDGEDELPDENENEPYPSATATDHPLSHPTMPPSTLFSQSALIFSTGVLATEAYPPKGVSVESPIAPASRPPAATYPQRAAGRKVEEYSRDRFEQNASGGRAAMEWAAGKLWRDIETPEGGE